MHDRPVRRIDWSPLLRYGGAFAGLAIIGYFVYQIALEKKVDGGFKVGATVVIVTIAIAGLYGIFMREPADEPLRDGQRLYTAEEVAELLNAVRAGGGRFVDAAAVSPATCLFCGAGGPTVKGLDGTRYHRACFQQAYLERQERDRDDLGRRATHLG